MGHGMLDMQRFCYLHRSRRNWIHGCESYLSVSAACQSLVSKTSALLRVVPYGPALVTCFRDCSGALASFISICIVLSYCSQHFILTCWPWRPVFRSGEVQRSTILHELHLTTSHALLPLSPHNSKQKLTILGLLPVADRRCSEHRVGVQREGQFHWCRHRDLQV